MPYCIHCGKQYKEADSFCMNCGKALPARANIVIQPLKPSGSPTGSPEKVRTIIFLLTALFIAFGVFSIIAGHNKETVKKSSRHDEDRVSRETVDMATADSTDIVTMPMDSIQQPAYEEAVVPAEAVPDETITATPDTVTLEMPKPYPR